MWVRLGRMLIIHDPPNEVLDVLEISGQVLRLNLQPAVAPHAFYIPQHPGQLGLLLPHLPLQSPLQLAGTPLLPLRDHLQPECLKVHSQLLPQELLVVHSLLALAPLHPILLDLTLQRLYLRQDGLMSGHLAIDLVLLPDH